MIPGTSFWRRPESSGIYLSTGGAIWAPAFAGATNTPPPGRSLLLTHPLSRGGGPELFQVYFRLGSRVSPLQKRQMIPG